jgi:hypothetical protein
VIPPKCYFLKGSKSNDKEDVKKMKSMLVRLNDDVDLMSYRNCLENSPVVIGINRGFIMIKSNLFTHSLQMVKIGVKISNQVSSFSFF